MRRVGGGNHRSSHSSSVTQRTMDVLAGHFQNIISGEAVSESEAALKQMCNEPGTYYFLTPTPFPRFLAHRLLFPIPI